jgi:hypothetical protein
LKIRNRRMSRTGVLLAAANTQVRHRQIATRPPTPQQIKKRFRKA